MDRQAGRFVHVKGTLRTSQETALTVTYTLYFNGWTSKQAAVAKLEAMPPGANDGDYLHLTLEDGRVVNCQVLDHSPYCAVIGDGPIVERRSRVRTRPAP